MVNIQLMQPLVDTRKKEKERGIFIFILPEIITKKLTVMGNLMFMALSVTTQSR